MNNKSTSAIIGGLVILLMVASFAIGILWTKVQGTQTGGEGSANNNNPTPAPTFDASKVAPVTEDDHLRGNRDAKIVLIEYSDLECPYCKSFHPTAQQVVNEYPEEVAWVYRHFPLSSIHPKAQKEAEGAECAAKIGGNDFFWSFIDTVYERSPEIQVSDLVQVATDIGLDAGEFESCLNSDEMASKVSEDYETGSAVGIRGTPGNILLNTETGEAELISGAVPFSTLQSKIEEMLN